MIEEIVDIYSKIHEGTRYTSCYQENDYYVVRVLTYKEEFNYKVTYNEQTKEFKHE